MKAENEKTAKAIEAELGAEGAKANKEAAEASNKNRAKYGLPPVPLSATQAKAAAAAADAMTCYDEVTGGKETTEPTDFKRCVIPDDQRRRLAENDCFKSIWINPDPKTDTTSAKAVSAWLAQGEFFNRETGLPTKDKEQEAFEFINVINPDTTEVGFAITGPVVIGFYCPPADTSPEALKTSVPKPREAPKPPVAPAGVKVDLGDTEDWPCPVISKEGEDEVRTPCSKKLCCGESKSADGDSFSSCRPSDKTEFTDDDGVKYEFKCYLDDARKLALSLSALAVSVAFYI